MGSATPMSLRITVRGVLIRIGHIRFLPFSAQAFCLRPQLLKYFVAEPFYAPVRRAELAVMLAAQCRCPKFVDVSPDFIVATAQHDRGAIGSVPSPHFPALLHRRWQADGKVNRWDRFLVLGTLIENGHKMQESAPQFSPPTWQLGAEHGPL